jgi:hypothetical protein
MCHPTPNHSNLYPFVVHLCPVYIKKNRPVSILLFPRVGEVVQDYERFFIIIKAEIHFRVFSPPAAQAHVDRVCQDVLRNLRSQLHILLTIFMLPFLLLH